MEHTASRSKGSYPIRLKLIWLIGITTAVRLLVAWQLELGNDEVYYWTYAEYPDLSHFDHPPMVGWLINVFTLNGLLTDAFFLRLGPIVLAALNSYLIYLTVKKIAGDQAGWQAAVLFNSSIYFSILSGFAILPDAPLVFFWLLSIYWMVDILPATTIDNHTRLRMLVFGVTVGMAILSKYTGAFVGVGALLFILLFNRQWLRDYSLYVAGFTAILLSSLILFWNVQNHFISFSFHGERVNPSHGLRFDYLLRELLGQVAYQNPLLLLVFVPTVIALLKKQAFVSTPVKQILLLNALPLWLVFTSFSLFRSTLPHWTGPSYLALLMLASIYWSGRGRQRINDNAKSFSIRLFAPALFLGALLTVAVFLINYSPFRFGKQKNPASLGDGDFTQDMYGWRKIGDEFKAISALQEREGKMLTGSNFISFRWFPGAHLDFYVARPMGRETFLLGPLHDIHKYAWINEQRGGLKRGEDYYYIAPSNYYRDPTELFGSYFSAIEPADTISIKRRGRIMRNALIFRLKNYKGNFENPLKQTTASHE